MEAAHVANERLSITKVPLLHSRHWGNGIGRLKRGDHWPIQVFPVPFSKHPLDSRSCARWCAGVKNTAHARDYLSLLNIAIPITGSITSRYLEYKSQRHSSTISSGIRRKQTDMMRLTCARRKISPIPAGREYYVAHFLVNFLKITVNSSEDNQSLQNVPLSLNRKILQ